MKKIIGVCLAAWTASALGISARAQALPLGSDEAVLENSIRDFRARRLFLRASEQLIMYLAWHPGAEEAGRWLEEIQEEQKTILGNSRSSLPEQLYAEGYSHFFDGQPEKALHDWKTLIGLSVADLWNAERLSEIREFADHLEGRLDGQKGLQALTEGRWAEAERLLERSLKKVYSDEVSAGLARARAEEESEAKSGHERLVREMIKKLMDEGEQSYQEGDLRVAQGAFQKVLGLDPSYAEARRFLALVEQAAQGGFDPEKAREYYKEGLRAYRSGQLAEAKGLWETSLRLDPSLDEARSSLERLSRDPSFSWNSSISTH